MRVAQIMAQRFQEREQSGAQPLENNWWSAEEADDEWTQMWEGIANYTLTPRISNAEYPGASWPRSTPEEQGMNSAILQQGADIAGKQFSYCMAVVRHGKMVGEWYWQGFNDKKPEIIWSSSKSVTSMIFGALQRDGFLNVIDSKAADFIPEFRGVRYAQDITIRHILTMDSGRYYDPITDFITPMGKDDHTEFAISLPSSWAPGAVHQYAQMAFQLLDRISVRAMNGANLGQYAKRAVFDPIGMQTTSWDTDRAGNPLSYCGVRTTCSDLVRFGYLHLHGGVWKGQRLWSEEYQRQSITPSPINKKKGYCWSLKSDGYYEARGLGGQSLIVDPKRDIVFARIGWTAPEGKPIDMYNKVIQSVQG
jgi:CubicO group peptidase (beta-lactamase class C family)